MAVERIRIRRDEASTWTSENPTLGLGELGLETDTNRMKAGDGSTAWISLDYLSLEPPGKLAPFAMDSAPGGYLECDGSAVSRSTYEALFDAIGTAWGSGDGSTTFNLPDLRGLGIRGAGTNATRTKADGSAYAGPAVGSYENDQFQGHWHELYANTGAIDLVGPTGNSLSGSNIYRVNDPNVTLKSNAIQDATTDGTNGTPRTGDETRGAAAGVLWCIKT